MLLSLTNYLHPKVIAAEATDSQSKPPVLAVQHARTTARATHAARKNHQRNKYEPPPANQPVTHRHSASRCLKFTPAITNSHTMLLTNLLPKKILRFYDSTIRAYYGHARFKTKAQHNQLHMVWCQYHGVSPVDFWMPSPGPLSAGLPSGGPPFPWTALLLDRPSPGTAVSLDRPSPGPPFTRITALPPDCPPNS